MTPLAASGPCIETGIKNYWVRTRPSFIDPRNALTRSLTYVQEVCFGLALQMTVGTNHIWETIRPKQFAKTANASIRAVQSALARLQGAPEKGEDEGIALISSRDPAQGTGREYTIVARTQQTDTFEAPPRARCQSCQSFEVDVDQEWIPVPFVFFTELPKRCDQGMYRLIKYIVVRTMRWDKNTKQIVIFPQDLTIDEMAQAVKRSRSEVEADLKKLREKNFIGSDEGTGRVKKYWPIPQNWGAGEIREPRKVVQPKRERRTDAEPAIHENPVQPKQTTESTPPVEFVSLPCGVCRNCGCYGPVDIVPDERKQPKKPPGAQQKPKKENALDRMMRAAGMK